MAVERNEDGSITVRSKNNVTNITGVVMHYDEKRKESFQKWVDKCAKLVNPCPHTFKEMEQYFLEICDAEPLESYDRGMRNFKCNVIINHFKDKLLHQPAEFSLDMTDEEIEKWHEEDNAMHNEARYASPKRFGLNIRGYRLPHTERNAVFYEEDSIKIQELNKKDEYSHRKIEQQDICIFFEETTEQCNSSGALL